MPDPSVPPDSVAPTGTASQAAQRFTAQARLRSFLYAFRGMAVLVRTQHNAWIHTVATLGATAAGLFFRIAAAEWCLVILAAALVWTAEALNTGLEFLADEVSVDRRDLIGKAKDLGAAAVLFSSLGAAAVGFIIFLPYLLAMLHKS